MFVLAQDAGCDDAIVVHVGGSGQYRASRHPPGGRHHRLDAEDVERPPQIIDEPSAELPQNRASKPKDQRVDRSSIVSKALFGSVSARAEKCDTCGG